MVTRAFPAWIRRSWPSGDAFRETKHLLEGLALHTVCQSAHCPNQAECWHRRTATFMILGNSCTRRCGFCAVNSGVPLPLDPQEPERVAEAARRLGLRHVVITSVTRDDLADGGAGQFAQTVLAVKSALPGATVEVLTPDFQGDAAAIGQVLDSHPAVFGHNIETVERLHPFIRDPRYRYARSLSVLKTAHTLAPDCYIKSGLMVGLGEHDEEIRATLGDLRRAGCSVVTLGQYLQPSMHHVPVVSFIRPEEFQEYEALAYSLGFMLAVSGPFVRSSYRAEALFSASQTNDVGDISSCATK